jgi:predicted outer membrane protein
MMNRIFLTTATAVSLGLSLGVAAAKDKPSEAFLKKAIEGNFAEVSMGDLAQKNGQSDGVKSYGKMLSTDHAAANQKAIDAAKSMGMTTPTGLNTKQKADYDKMAKISGADFDKKFASFMVEDHKKDLADYKKESKLKDAAGEYASGLVDTLQKHLDTAKALKPAR